MPYALRPGLHYCLCSSRSVFLDLPADRYFCLPAAMDRSFQAWASGDPPQDIRPLIEAGILILSDSVLGVPVPPQVERPDAELPEPEPVGTIWALRAAAEQLCAGTRLRWSSFGALINRLEAMPAIAFDRAEKGADIATVAAAFARARLLMRSRDNCLAQSMAFHRVCRSMGIDASLVIGVQLDPFAAHCWVQRENVVLNDHVERVRHFTPILAL